MTIAFSLHVPWQSSEASAVRWELREGPEQCGYAVEEPAIPF